MTETEDRAALEYAEGVFRGYAYLKNRVETLSERVQEAEAMRAGISSPRIKSAEEAKYKRSTAPPKDCMISGIMRIDLLKQQLADSAAQLAKVDSYLAGLDPWRRELFKNRYELRYSLRAVAGMENKSLTYIRKVFDDMALAYLKTLNT